MSMELMAPLMFAGLVIFLLLGYPVAFSLAANGLLFALMGIHYGFFDISLMQALPERVLGIIANQTLLAIPFFTFMGLVLERSGMAEDLLETVGQLFGNLRGGLAYAVILVGALLGATTGVVAASVIAMGLISLPIMMRYGYDQRLAAGVIAASGTLAQIIPPSLVLIVLADQLGISVGDLYKGALVPSLVLTGLYIAFVLLITLVKPAAAPALPRGARTLRGRALLRRVGASLLPPLLLIFLVLGTIFLGWATPTEGGAMGASGALALALIKRRLSLDLLKQAMDSTTRLTSFVVFILIGSTVFSLVFRGMDGDLWVEHLLTALPGGALGFLIVVNLLIFVLAFFLDFFEIAFIIIPLLAPVAHKLGIDLIWFGVLIGINMQTSFMHPPFGFALFYLRSVAPKSIRTSAIYRGAIPFVVIQLLMVGLLIAFPGLTGVRHDALSPGVIDVPLEQDGYGDYFLPREWR
ncbi:TRAP dicarboxylate transporter, DctM subunit, unknown substrate 6 [Sulfuriferula multivorans]|uniref:TRAP transporter large permease protein n=1 Tax=Sulfuriferula multivorans TaxID=1559896 RepID=A0A401JF90_9PROT|nr:TRAP transporter large permease subunit [Sulfuriferula multivorans]GBL46307.1 TRAP dicarboxylate transporter, DctM subunit, unknown substrate 6 [Sulfuriferula multivorans]